MIKTMFENLYRWVYNKYQELTAIEHDDLAWSWSEYLEAAIAEFENFGEVCENASHEVVKSFIYQCWLDEQDPQYPASVIETRESRVRIGKIRDNLS